MMRATRRLDLNGRTLLVLLIIRFRLYGLFSNGITLNSALMTVLPRILCNVARISNITDGRDYCSVFAQILYNIARPTVVNNSITRIMRFMGLPPIVTYSRIVTANGLLFTLFLNDRMILRILLATSELLGRIKTEYRTRNRNEDRNRACSVSFRGLISCFGSCVCCGGICSLQLRTRIRAGRRNA